jgi:flagellar assembly protein FliH
MSSRILRPAEVEFAPLRWSEAGPVGEDAGPLPLPAHRALPATGSTGAAPPDWELLVRQAREEGRREGEIAARQSLERELDALRARLVQSIEAVAGFRPRLRQEAERQVVELALAVARRILRREVSIDPEAVGGLVRSALDNLSLREVVSVRCHPSFATSIQAGLERLGAPVAIRVEPDPGLEAGGVVIETAHGALDASVNVQLAEIERGFADLLEPASGRRP